MIKLFKLTFPIEEPVLIFTLVLLIILIAPIMLQKIRVPGLLGLIIAGIIVGPKGLNILHRDASIVLFGTVGLLYIMFMAGLEIDMIDFKKNKSKSFVFGALTFLVPMTIGTTIFYLLGYKILSAVLIASMFSSHTLISYPIATKLGVKRNEAVTITIGGTIVTDTAVLLLLSIIAGSVQGNLGMDYWLRLTISLTIFVIIVMYLFPMLARWFFKQIESEKGAQYIFVLTIVFASAFLAELAGVEAIIGAFLAGLALNQLIPHTSALMNRIEFVGNNIFIPFFLISVGMLVDLRVLFRGPEALLIAGTIVAVSPLSKFTAAYLTQKIFGYTPTQRNLIFGLSSAHAAATLAVALVGFEFNIINEDVLNGTILLILVSCLVSSFTTEKAARRLAIIENRRKPNLSDKPDRILVPIGNPETIEKLIDLAIILKNPEYQQPIYPLAVVVDNDNAQEEIYNKNRMLQEAIKYASATDSDVQLVSKIDINIASGILRAIKELMITETILGWNAKITTRDRIFGTILDNLLENTEQMILVCKLIQPLNTTERLIVIVPKNAELERGFLRWVGVIKRLAQQLGAKVIFQSNRRTLNKLRMAMKTNKPDVEADYNIFSGMNDFEKKQIDIRKDDMVVVVSGRKGTISYNSNMDYVPRVLSRKYKENSFIIIYPEQHPLLFQDNQIKAMNNANKDRP